MSPFEAHVLRPENKFFTGLYFARRYLVCNVKEERMLHDHVEQNRPCFGTNYRGVRTASMLDNRVSNGVRVLHMTATNTRWPTRLPPTGTTISLFLM